MTISGIIATVAITAIVTVFLTIAYALYSIMKGKPEITDDIFEDLWQETNTKEKSEKKQ